MSVSAIVALALATQPVQSPTASGWPREFPLHCTYEQGVETRYAAGWQEPWAVQAGQLGRSTFRMGVRVGQGFDWTRGGDRGAETVEGHADHIFISMRDGAPILQDDPTSTFVYRAGPGDDEGPFQMMWNESGYVTVLFGQCVRPDLRPPED